MKNIKNQDERILTQRRRIQSDGFQLLIYALLLSVVVQQFFLQAPPSQFAGEFLCLAGAGIYHLIRSLNLGDDFYCDENNSGKGLFKNALFSGIGSLIVFAFITGQTKLGDLLTFFVIYTVVFGGATYLIYYISKKKKDNIERELDMGEDDIE